MTSRQQYGPEGTIEHILSNVSSRREAIIVDPKRVAYERNKELEKDQYNPTMTGFLGRFFWPVGVVSIGYFVLSYLYHRFVPVEDLLTQNECITILQQIRTAWGVAITESARQETKLLNDYQDQLSIEQQQHLLDVLRQTLLSDLDITEQQICTLYKTTQYQVKKSVDYYIEQYKLIQKAGVGPPKALATASSSGANKGGGDDDDDGTKSEPAQDLHQLNAQINGLVLQITKYIQLVLPNPSLPLGWTYDDVFELLSQWFELRIVVMEKTFMSLVMENPPKDWDAQIEQQQQQQENQQNLNEKNKINKKIQFNANFYTLQRYISPLTGKPTTKLRLTQDQIILLNERYNYNIQLQVDLLCEKRGITYPFLLQLNRCVMSLDEFEMLVAKYKGEQMKRLVILGIEVATTNAPSQG